MTSKVSPDSVHPCSRRRGPEGWAELGHVEGREMGFPGMGGWVVAGQPGQTRT